MEPGHSGFPEDAMIWRNGNIVLLLLIVPSAVSAQRKPGLVYDSTGQLVPPGRTSAPVQPQLPLPIRRGPWLNLGLGYGSVDCGNSGCTMGAPTGNLEVGWAVGPKVLLGAAILGWTKADQTMRITNGSLGLRLRYYPTETAGFFFTGGFGLGMIRFSAGPQGRGNPFTTTGYAFLGGLGCDFRIAPSLSVTPFANGSGIRTRDGSNHLRGDLWQVGIGLTIH